MGQSITLTLLTTEHNGTTYGAAKCYVTVGRSSNLAVACLAGTERTILLPSDAHAWLIAHGLPRETADTLIHDALAQEDQ